MSRSDVLHPYGQDVVQSADWETNKVAHTKVGMNVTSLQLSHSDTHKKKEACHPEISDY